MSVPAILCIWDRSCVASHQVALSDGASGDTLRTWQLKGEPLEVVVARCKDDGGGGVSGGPRMVGCAAPGMRQKPGCVEPQLVARASSHLLGVRRSLAPSTHAQLLSGSARQEWHSSVHAVHGDPPSPRVAARLIARTAPFLPSPASASSTLSLIHISQGIVR